MAGLIGFPYTYIYAQEAVRLVKEGRLKLDSQAGRSVGYRQVLEYVEAVWGFPPPPGASDGENPYSLKVSCFVWGGGLLIPYVNPLFV